MNWRLNRSFFEKSTFHEDDSFHFKLLVKTFQNAWHLLSTNTGSTGGGVIFQFYISISISRVISNYVQSKHYFFIPNGTSFTN